jgi:antidote-toxin recognition MazE-like antitoxin
MYADIGGFVVIYTTHIHNIYMPFEPKVKLRKIGNSFTVTIPVDMIEDLGWKEGDILRIGLENKNKLIVHREEIK